MSVPSFDAYLKRRQLTMVPPLQFQCLRESWPTLVVHQSVREEVGLYDADHSLSFAAVSGEHQFPRTCSCLSRQEHVELVVSVPWSWVFFPSTAWQCWTHVEEAWHGSSEERLRDCLLSSAASSPSAQHAQRNSWRLWSWTVGHCLKQPPLVFPDSQRQPSRVQSQLMKMRPGAGQSRKIPQWQNNLHLAILFSRYTSRSPWQSVCHHEIFPCSVSHLIGKLHHSHSEALDSWGQLI